MLKSITFLNLLIISTNTYGQLKKNLRFELSDDVRVYSDKAYRKNKGQIFEAVGNVIIISGSHTIYGETATLEVKTKNIHIEGNVRYNTQGLTLFGSRLDFNASKNEFNIEDARILTDDFNIIAKKMKKVSETEFFTEEAEFTTCRDCKESWTVYGKKIHLTINEYVRISHAEVRVKGINILYVPYLVLPVKSERESGLLFPRFYQRRNEGMAFEQPFFWAIDEDKDLTFKPLLFGERGYGTDIEYRQVFDDYSWFNVKSTLVEDKMYLPLTNNDSLSGESYTRHFSEMEGQIKTSPNHNSHFRFQILKDIDFKADFFDYTEGKFEGSSARIQGFNEHRFEMASVSAEFDYGQNFLYGTPDEVDKQYVQVFPELRFQTDMQTLFQSDSMIFKNISWSMDSTYTVFRQQIKDEATFLRNVRRVDLRPNLNWQVFSFGPFDLSTNYTLDFQSYTFSDETQSAFGKKADMLKTEFSFSIEKIFGSAYRHIYTNDQIKPVIQEEKLETQDNKFIGNIPEFKKSFTSDNVVERSNSYRHGQEYKLIHYLITGENEYGNRRFFNQIQDNAGWFDYLDAVRSAQSDLGANVTRTLIPLENTVELQWNNSLTRKSPSNIYSLKDGRYLKDNFNYEKIGHFNISQGIILGTEEEQEDLSFKQRLTRLYIDIGMSLERWMFDVDEYYFHDSDDHIFNFDIARRFDYFTTILGYNFNSLNSDDVLRTVKLGLGVLPAGFMGFSYNHIYDIENTSNIARRLELDLMPNNNCWIFNFGYEEGTYGQLVSFNFIFNFADQKYANYRKNYLDIARLRR